MYVFLGKSAKSGIDSANKYAFEPTCSLGLGLLELAPATIVWMNWTSLVTYGLLHGLTRFV